MLSFLVDLRPLEGHFDAPDFAFHAQTPTLDAPTGLRHRAVRAPGRPSPRPVPSAAAPRRPGGRLGEHRVEPQEAQVLGERPPRECPEVGLGRQLRRRRRHRLPGAARAGDTDPTGFRVRRKGLGRPDISRPAASRSASRDTPLSAPREPPRTFPGVPNGPPPPRAPAAIGARRGGARRIEPSDWAMGASGLSRELVGARQIFTGKLRRRSWRQLEAMVLRNSGRRRAEPGLDGEASR